MLYLTFGVGAEVVGSGVVGASVVGAGVVGCAEKKKTSKSVI